MSDLTIKELLDQRIKELLEQRTAVRLVVFVVIYVQSAWTEVIGVYSSPETATTAIEQDVEYTGGYKEKYRIMRTTMDSKPVQLEEYRS